MSWWLENNIRMIQNNLRDIDAAMDVDKLVEALESFDCNCVMVGAAGITAYYPSDLPEQYVSPYLQGRDTLGEIVRKCHEKGIRVIVRFDFSKVHESLEAGHPDWFVVTESGGHWHFGDTVHTCLCGKYQQEHSLNIIREVITRYPVDGVFFNYFGMHTRDYAGREYGICHCEGCRKMFRAFSGLELPKEDSAPEIWEKYRAFTIAAASDMMRKVQALVHSSREDIAVCTYHYPHVDMVRNESNSSPSYAYPVNLYLYQSAENVASVRTNAQGMKVSSNCVINAYSINHRFTGVSKELTSYRLYEEMAQGGILDFCIIGVFEGYPDEEAFEGVREVFHFHKENERYFKHLISQARVAVLHSVHTRAVSGGSPAFHGVFRMLKEEHIPFDLLGYETIEMEPDALNGCRALIVPDAQYLSERIVREARRRDILLLVTDLTEKLEDGAAALLGAQVTETEEDDLLSASYWNTREKDIFNRFKRRHWIVQQGLFAHLNAPAYDGLLPRVSAAPYAPPERAYGHEPTKLPGALYSREHRAVIIPWRCAYNYSMYANADCKHVLVNLLDAFCEQARAITMDAPAAVEVFYDRLPDGNYMLQLLNLTGCSGGTWEPHIPVHDIRVTLPLPDAQSVTSLTHAACTLETSEDGAVVIIPRLERYEALIIKP